MEAKIVYDVVYSIFLGVDCDEDHVSRAAVASETILWL